MQDSAATSHGINSTANSVAVHPLIHGEAEPSSGSYSQGNFAMCKSSTPRPELKSSPRASSSGLVLRTSADEQHLNPPRRAVRRAAARRNDKIRPLPSGPLGGSTSPNGHASTRAGLTRSSYPFACLGLRGRTVAAASTRRLVCARPHTEPSQLSQATSGETASGKEAPSKVI